MVVVFQCTETLSEKSLSYGILRMTALTANDLLPWLLNTIFHSWSRGRIGASTDKQEEVKEACASLWERSTPPPGRGVCLPLGKECTSPWVGRVPPSGRGVHLVEACASLWERSTPPTGRSVCLPLGEECTSPWERRVPSFG